MEAEEEIKNKYDPKTLQDLLPLYYKRLFPHKPFYRWLSYGHSEISIFTHREFSFVTGDVYIRYMSFENQSELEKEICTRIPSKIDIGAILNIRPKYHKAVASVHPIQRELVFDIDMSDYDEVRTCCKGAEICIKCWKFMTIACRVIDTALRKDFGFEHILWVFSGRRGIHCWVCDKTARILTAKGRSSVAEYMQILVHSSAESMITRVSLGEKIHHSIRRALKIIEPMFEEICLVDQDLFGNAKGISRLLQMIPDENIRKDLEVHLKKPDITSKEVWDIFVKFCIGLRSKGNTSRKMMNIIEEVQLAYLYPRIDINVTKGFNHLLKAPFCVHPNTGKICVPFNPNAVAKFDPTTVPTITALMDEINKFDDKIKAEDAEEDKYRIKDYKKTGMFKGVVVFEEFLRKLESSFKKKAIDVSDIKMEF